MLFKYLSPDAIDKVLLKSGVSLRFQIPEDFNDPFELFLQPDSALDGEILAFFDRYVGEIPQLPTACFSKHPDITTLWAHYAENSAGMCIAFNERQLANQYPVAYLHDVSYQDHPGAIPAGLIEHAFTTGKNRHVEHLMLPEAYRAAYFIKHEDWAYEKEKRLIVQHSEVEEKDGLLLSYIPIDAVETIICGSNANADTLEKCKLFTEQNDLDLLNVKTTRNSFIPYFTRSNDNAGFRWDRNEFFEINLCNSCLNPSDTHNSDEPCSYCKITETHRLVAQTQNIHSLAASLGIVQPTIGFAGIAPVGYETVEDE